VNAPLLLTPMMRQYQELKRRYPDHLLLFRLGDFYEMFFADAEVGAKALQIALTSRQGAPMAGIPHHAGDAYIARLIKAGHRVAICEQMEAAGKGKKLLRREVVRVITPGTITDTAYLPGGANNFLLVLVRRREALGLALTDVSTGEFWVGEGGPELLEAALLRRPAEVVLPATLRDDRGLCGRLGARGAVLTFCDPAMFALEAALAALTSHFRVAVPGLTSVSAAGPGLQAAGAALAYLRDTQGQALDHVARIQTLVATDAMAIDETAAETLELFPGLFGALDQTETPMGARTQRHWILRPLVDVEAIRARQDAIAALVADPGTRQRMRRLLRHVGDIERLASRAAMRIAHGRDLVGLRSALGPLGDLRAATLGLAAPLLQSLGGQVEVLDEVRQLLERALVDEPPLTLHEGGLIRPGFSEALDRVTHEIAGARLWIATLEERERARTGISALRVRFNRVFGYGIEVSRAQSGRVPPEYVRRQTLAGAERYVTPELREHEATVLSGEERIRRVEYEVFEQMRSAVATHAEALIRTARAIGQLDALAGLAEVAHGRGHVRPLVDDGALFSISDGRHPLLEGQVSGQVTPNDIALDPDTSVMIITGPNMSGKSVYLRQAALLAIMAQMGAFIPARAARLGIIDRIFTRVGAQDNLAAGQSTFLVEMVETATILTNVTPRSLVLLDEIGRGTSTYDGLAIAWAVVEHLHERAAGAKVLFATHFHELTQLARELPRVRNFHVAVREWNDEIIFLHKVEPGGTDRSYGIQVARLAGVPAAVIERAKALLAELEAARSTAHERVEAAQLGLFEQGPHPLVVELEKLDLSRATPLDALNLLAEWQRLFTSTFPTK